LFLVALETLKVKPLRWDLRGTLKGMLLCLRLPKVGRYFSIAELLNGRVFLLVVLPLGFVDGLFISLGISIAQSLQHLFLNNKRNKLVLG